MIHRKVQERSPAIRAVVFEEIGSDPVRNDCQILYLEHEGTSVTLLDRLRDSPVLTISYLGGFLEKGGVISLFQSGGRLKSRISLPNAQRSELKVGPEMIELADDVIKAEPEGQSGRTS
jgi:hypothetical protein